jgi:hypothetical protein
MLRIAGTGPTHRCRCFGARFASAGTRRRAPASSGRCGADARPRPESCGLLQSITMNFSGSRKGSQKSHIRAPWVLG